MKVIINEEKYRVVLEKNETAKSFVRILPKVFNMNDLNKNEKYIYLDTILPIDPYYPGKINTGDIMLYGNDCLVIFYKSFDTQYSYTKIGHIEDLKDLGNTNITIKFEK